MPTHLRRYCFSVNSGPAKPHEERNVPTLSFSVFMVKRVGYDKRWLSMLTLPIFLTHKNFFIMKTRNLLLIVALFVMGWTACTTIDGADLGNYEGTPQKKYTVRLSCAGELDITQQPLTRYTPTDNDLYAVSVSQKPTSASPSTSSKDYAYGLFDNLANVELEVLADHKYNVSVYMIVDGKNKVYSDSTYVSDVLHRCYAEPFKVSKSSGVEFGVLTNKFTYSNTEHLLSYDKLREVNASSASYLNENIESYYGRSGEFVPTTDGETISIHMERMTYGIKFVAGDFLSEGVLKIKLSTTGLLQNHSKTFRITPDNRTYETTFRYHSPGNWYNYENLLDAKYTLSLNIEWQKNDTKTIKLKQTDIQVNRLKQTVVNINMYEDQVLGNSSLSATYEDIDITESDTNQYTFGEKQGEYIW